MSDTTTAEDAPTSEAMLAELRELRAERDPLQARIDWIDGRRWDLFEALRKLTPPVPNRVIGEAYGVSEPAVIQTLKKGRPQAVADR